MGDNILKAGLIEEIRRIKEESFIPEGLATRLIETVEALSRREKELQAIRECAEVVLEQKGFMASARTIFDNCKALIGATSGYVALLSDTGEENEVLFLESGGLSCDVDPDLPMPIRGLRKEAYELNQTVYHNDFMNSPWLEFLPKGHVTLKNVMFAPLVLAEKTVGIIGLANKDGDFDDNDAGMASRFGENGQNH